MTQQTINVGSSELAGDGEGLRTAFIKVNENFTELYTTGGPTGPTGPAGPGADQQLNTSSNVAFNSVTVNELLKIDINGKAVFTSTSNSSKLELWNSSSVVQNHNSIKFLRSRGPLSLLGNQVIGSLDVDGFQTTTGYASDYSYNRLFPGLRWITGGVWNTNSAPTVAQIFNRVSYSPILPFPYNVTNSQSTDTTVVISASFSPATFQYSGNQISFDPYQGFNLSSGNSTPINNGVFGTNRLGSLAAGNFFQIRQNSAFTTSTNLLGSNSFIQLRTRTDHIPYQSQGAGGLDTSIEGQINWVAGSTATWSNSSSPSIVKGTRLDLNSTRYQQIERSVTRGLQTTTVNSLWNTSTYAGDVLGTVSFQGGLIGVSDATLSEGGVDGVIIRAYAKNNWEGEHSSTTTNVTYNNNQSALRIEITTSTTIGPVSAGSGFSQLYKNVFEIDATTATFSTDVIPSSNLTYNLGSLEKQWKSLYVGTGTIYIGGVPITVNTSNNTLIVGASSGESTTATNLATESYVIDYVTQHGGGGGGLPSITIPATPEVLYKGLQASYGVVHSNENSNELNVNKIVIYKPATTTVTIDPTGSQDTFQVSGLGSSDVLAMFVVYGNDNAAKPLADLQNFTQAVIDNVILIDGVEGDFRTVDQMKTAFYDNYATLASAANGLDTNFQFYQSPTPALNGGPTITQEGSGAVFDIVIGGSGPYTYDSVTPTTGGTNYRLGHKILVDGTALEGLSGTNDAIITVNAINSATGQILSATISGTYGNARAAPFTYSEVTGTNYQLGSGFTVNSVYTDGVNVGNYGSNYVVGDVVTLLGENITGGTTPENNITITATSVGGSGELYGFTTSGTVPGLWPTNNISDGGDDQYDTANYINTNFANQINYNGGNTVVDGTAAFGTGSTYSFVYDTAIFGILSTGSSATLISTSGNSGADGGSITEKGSVFGAAVPEQIFDNAVTHLNIVGDPYIGNAVTFIKTDDGSEVDILIPDDGAGAGVGITRDGQQGIYNPYREGEWDSDVSPGGTLWNIDGWTNFKDVESRTYTTLYAAFGSGGLGNKIVGTECVMYLPDNGKYYAVKFTQWTQGANGGGFAYTRRELDLANLQEGIRFDDGTVLKSAEGLGRVKLQSPGNRRIEEVYGYKSVSVTSRNRDEITGATYTSVNAYELRVKKTTEINAFVGPYYNTSTVATWYISFDNVTFRAATLNSDGGNNWMFYYVNANSPTLQVEDEPFYIRRDVGGDPVVWWNKDELPGGGTNFRGAVIDYHAFTGESTIIGTIHIVDDSGEEHIAHTEVQSGSTDGENDDLWFVTTEGEIRYRRIDGESKTLKVQWSAKVFYGSEFYD